MLNLKKYLFLPFLKKIFSGNFFCISLFVSFFICLFIALYPENSAELLTPIEGWTLNGNLVKGIPVSSLNPKNIEMRNSIFKNSSAQIFAFKTEINGKKGELSSPYFIPSKHMVVIIGGNDRSRAVFFECKANMKALEIFRGNVNTIFTEAQVSLPQQWCPNEVRLKMELNPGSYLAISPAFKVSSWSIFKTSSLGLLPYLLLTLITLSILMVCGLGLFFKNITNYNYFPILIITLGLSSLFIFYSLSILNKLWHSGILALFWFFVIYLYNRPKIFLPLKIYNELKTYFHIWAGASFLYFVILTIGTNNLGHWDPNYRFWPAIWSSDNELPWLFAQGIREGWDLNSLIGGYWSPSDRPPLMTGTYLILSDFFKMLQINNDGNYLFGRIYNIASIVLSSLWAPVVFWLLKILKNRLENSKKMLILFFIGLMPFVIFNSIYGWAKFYSAAFALTAVGNFFIINKKKLK
jgi:hypothetical protein